MREASSGQELKIKEVDTRIEREIAELRTAIQASKVSVLSLFFTVFFQLSELSTGRYAPVSCRFRYVFFARRLVCFTDTTTPVTGCSALLMAYLRFRL